MGQYFAVFRSISWYFVVFRHKVILHRNPNQKWILYEVEPPTKTWSLLRFSQSVDAKASRYLFNITSTYAVDSNVPLKNPLIFYLNNQTFKRLKEVNYASGKKKNVMWFVSHCKTKSKREEYVRELRKYIDVDIYGKCGNLTCGNVPWLKTPSNCSKTSVSKQYRFYLSFENSLCEDYVTEKLMDILRLSMDTIPIVMGLYDYKNLMPEYSFIDVTDFSSPQDLAVYLHTVAQNSSLFNQYLRTIKSVKTRRLPSRYECRLCRYLHEHLGKIQIVPDVFEYWGAEKKCVTPNEHWNKTAHAVDTFY